MLYPFRYLAPDSLAEAIAMRQTYVNAKFLAGGTALLLAIERRETQVATVIDLKHIKHLKNIEVTPEKELQIGARVTLREIIDSELVRQVAPVLIQTAKHMATPQVRNLGTIGGNIASGLAGADLVTTLLTLDARLLIITVNGEERVALHDYISRSELTHLREAGIIRNIILPQQAGQAMYQKLMVRHAVDVPLANVAICVQTNSRQVTSVRIAAGDCEGHPSRLTEAESILHEQSITSKVIDDVVSIVTETVKQPSDHRASEAYRRRMVGVLTRRALTQLLDPV